MRVRTLSVICLLACLIVAIPILAQQRSGAAQADPLTGTWAGDWGPNANDRNQVSVDLKLDGKTVTGVVKTTGRPEVTLSNSTYDAATRTVKMEAEARNPRSGATVKYVIEGKLEGSSMTGSWNHDNTKGDFKLTKK
jgi:hypothetical protein